MIVVQTIDEVRAEVAKARKAGQRIGCVPTMGALHEGHASLIRRANAISDFVVVTVFVNPTQFGPNEDFSKYPRTLDADVAISESNGAGIVFAPPVSEIYHEPNFTAVEVSKLGDHLCGASRPGHFRGVTTVVLKLFNIVTPDVAVFGAKDGQQVRIVKQMVRDLNVPVSIDVMDTVREPDGLAMSSRNRYLSPVERSVAPQIYQSLLSLRQRAMSHNRVDALESELAAGLAAIPGARVDYAKIVDDQTLQPLESLDRPALAAVAVFLGATRLIDNITLP